MGILKSAIKGVNAFPDIHRVNDGWHALSGSYTRFENDDYENVYGSASKIINRVADVSPYAINEKKERVLNAVALDKTFKPNQQMSGYDFREALFGKFIVLGEALVRVHTKNDDNATPDNIIGYTFLENAVRTVSPVDGVITYTVNGKTFTDKEVIRIHGFNPNSLLDKYSPTQAAKRWSGIDDYIADYQRGFFKNGAVPAGEFIITAASTQDYKDIKAGMQQAHRGAGKNNNVVYSYRPIDGNGKAQNSQIEWIPFNSDNKSLDLGAIFEQVNSKIDSAFGVPASIRGVGENNNYATAQMDARNFVENTINPLLLKVWTSFTHELNRITGGLGYAIVYDLDIPSVSDDKKVQAETHQITLTTISNALQAGFDIKSVLEAIDAPESYQSLVSGYVAPVQQDDPDVDMGNEVEDSPENAVEGGIVKSVKAVSARQFENELSGLIPEDTGYIMLDTEKIEVLSNVENAEDDLVPNEDTDFGNLPGENTPHITLLDGVLNSPDEIRDIANALYRDTPIKSIEIDHIDYFDLEHSNAVVAKIKLTDELVQLRENFDLIPHASKFSVYAPHVTLAYLNKDADVNKWVDSLSSLSGKELSIKGINLGDETKGAAKSTDPKGLKALTPVERLVYEEQLETIAAKLMQKQIDRALIETKAVGDATEDDIREFADEMLKAITTILVVQGAISYAEGIGLLVAIGVSTSGTSTFSVSDNQLQRYRNYLLNVGDSYSRDTQLAIQAVLENGMINQLTRAELERNLQNIMQTNEWRVKRIGVTETNRAGGNASLFSMEQIEQEAGVQVNKVWRTSRSDACQYCKALDGTSLPVRESFVPVGDAVIGIDGGIMINDFVSMEIANGHPNCNCYLTYEVVR